MKVICIIPARGGSKSIELKNIKLINRIPLIDYTIKNAFRSNLFDHIVVSSDNKKIKKNCSKFKNLLIFDRDISISKDSSSTEEVVSDVLSKIYKAKFYIPDWIFILEPTSPLRSVKTILKAYNLIKKKKIINSIISIKEINNIPSNYINHRLKYLKKRVSRRQDREKFYEESSTIYCVSYKYFRKNKKIVDNKPYAFLVSKMESIDINDIEDFHIASAIIKYKKNGF